MSDTSHANGPGAPSKYKPEYCEMLRAHCASGLSFEAFAGKIKVNRDTIYEWEKVHPEFAQAKSEAIELSRLFWEQMGVAHVLNVSESFGKNEGGKSTSLNSSVWIYNMKVRFPEWRVDSDKEKDQATSQLTQSEKAEVMEMVGKTKEFLAKGVKK